MTTEDIELEIGNWKFDGRLTVPSEPTGSGIVVLPGGGHGPYGGIFDRFAEQAGESGRHVLRYQSWAGPFEFRQKTYAALHDELDAAVERLRAEGCETVSIVGKSFGGGVALTHVPDGVDRMLLWSPAMRVDEDADFEEIKEICLVDIEEPPLSPDDLADVEVPVGIVQGDADEVQPIEASRELVAGLPDSELIEVEGLDHSYSDREWGAEVVEITLEWLDENE